MSKINDTAREDGTLTPLEQRLDEMLTVRGRRGAISQQDIALVWEAIDAARATEPGLDVELRDALTELLDDYLATNGPDGYPHLMPMAWRLVAARIGRTRP